MSKQLVIVFGHSPASNIGLVRSLSKIGCDSVIVSTTRSKKTIHPEFYSKYVVGHHFLDPKDVKTSIEFLVSKYGSCNPIPILVPTSDVAASFFDENYDQLSLHFLLPKLDHTKCNSVQLLNKSYQKQLAIQAGFNVLDSWVIDVDSNGFVIPQDICYPCYTKGCKSIEVPKRFQKRCDNEDQLSEQLKSIASFKKASVLVEKYAKIEKEWGIMAYCNGNDVYIPSLTEFTSIGKGAYPGVSIQGRTQPIDINGDLYKAASRFLKNLNMVGLCNIDLIQMDGKFYFSEINIRYAAYCYAVDRAGVNLPAVYIQSMQHQSLHTDMFVNHTITYFSEFIACQDIYAGKLSIKEAKKLSSISDISFIKDKDDMNPYYRYIAYFMMQMLFRPFKHMKTLFH